MNRVKKLTTVIAAMLLLLACFLSNFNFSYATTDGGPTSPAEADESMMALDEESPTKYIVIQMNNVTSPTLDSWLAKVHNIYGNTYKDEPVQVAFGVCGPFLLYQTVDEMKAIIDQGFELAVKYSMPVYFQIDDMGYWANNPTIVNGTEQTFIENTQWHETRSFATDDYAKYWFNWGTWNYAPRVPALGVPEFQSWIENQMEYGVVRPILENVKKLIAMDKQYLFAGIAIGWESNVCDAREYPVGAEATHIEGGPTAVIEEEDLVIPFYRSLQAMTGISSQAELEAATLPAGVSIEDEGAETVSKEEAIIIYNAFRAVQQYSEKIAKVTALTKLDDFDYRIPRTKIFTHIIAKDSLYTSDGMNVINSKSTPSSPPIDAAVNPYCTPGFTLNQESGASYNLPQLKQKILKLDPTRKYFAATEHYATPNVRATYESSMANFQELMLEAGGMQGLLMAMYGFTDPTDTLFYMPKEFDSGFVRAVYQAKHNGIG